MDLYSFTHQIYHIDSIDNMNTAQTKFKSVNPFPTNIQLGILQELQIKDTFPVISLKCHSALQSGLYRATLSTRCGKDISWQHSAESSWPIRLCLVLMIKKPAHDLTWSSAPGWQHGFDVGIYRT